MTPENRPVDPALHNDQPDRDRIAAEIFIRWTPEYFGPHTNFEHVGRLAREAIKHADIFLEELRAVR